MIELKTDPWLANLPHRWQSRRLKHVASCNDEVLGDNTPKALEIEYVDIGSVSSNGLVNNTERLEFANAPSRARRVVRDGDIIVSTVRTYLKAIAPIVNPPDNLIASTGFAVIRCNSGIVPRFMAYCLRTEGFVGEVISRSVGISYPAINATDLINIEVPVPHKDEQKQIAGFLDYETAKIDALIEKQQQLIALLGEKRQAVISHAVTKGLNPDAPMRDSGVEWLGQVPEHWDQSKVGLLCSIISKGTTPRNGFSDQTDVPFIRVNNLSFTGDIALQDLVYVSKLTHNTEISRSKVYAGDVLMNLVGPPLGKVGFVSDVFPEYNINQAVAFFRVVGVDPRFLCAWLQTSFARDWFLLRAKKTSGQANLTLEHCRTLPIALPDRKEQVAIVNELDSRLKTVDATIESSWDLVDLLQERRTALISAAVTGKIDVRGWKRPSADSPLETEMEIA